MDRYDMFNMHDTQKVTLLRIDAESSVVVTLWEEFEFGCPEGWYGVALRIMYNQNWLICGGYVLLWHVMLGGGGDIDVNYRSNIQKGAIL